MNEDYQNSHQVRSTENPQLFFHPHPPPSQGHKMTSEVSPVVAGFAVLLIFLFIVLLMTWCCRQFSRTKEASVNLVPHTVSPRYITTIDVQTGLPVVVDIESLGNGPMNHARVAASQQRRTSCPINTRRHSLYGAVDQVPQSYQEFFPRTPPPPYSEVEVYPPNRT